MKFNLFSLYNAIIVLAYIIPSTYYLFKFVNRLRKRKFQNKTLDLIEIISRLLLIIVLIVPLGQLLRTSSHEFALATIYQKVIYIGAVPALCLAQLILWFISFKNPTPLKDKFLAVIPCAMFVLISVAFSDILILVCSLCYAVSHIIITFKNL